MIYNVKELVPLLFLVASCLSYFIMSKFFHHVFFISGGRLSFVNGCFGCAALHRTLVRISARGMLKALGTEARKIKPFNYDFHRFNNYSKSFADF